MVLIYLFICAGFNLIMRVGVIHSRSTDLGVFWSHLTAQLLKTDGMLFSVHSGNFQWYFTGPKSFNGILRRSQPFDGIEPIFSYFYSCCLLHESDVIPFPFFNFIFCTFLFMTCKLINFRIGKSVLYLLAFYLMY
jgi:hypothetical protein